MKRSSSNMSITLLLTLTLVNSAIAELSPFTKFHVKIVNLLPSNKSPLVAHCKSKDNDLGIKSLPTNGETQWGFRVDFLNSTLFFCSLSFSHGGRVHRAVFDVFRAKEEFVTDFCGYNTCTWIAQEDGIHAYNSKTEVSHLVYLWTDGGSDDISPAADL